MICIPPWFGSSDCVVNREMISSLCVAELCDWWALGGCRALARDLVDTLIHGLKAGIIRTISLPETGYCVP